MFEKVIMKAEVIVAMVCITILEIVALLKGIDGALLSSAVAIIAGLAGYQIREFKENSKINYATARRRK